MINRRNRRLSGIPVAAALLASLALPSCLFKSKPPQTAAVSTDPTGANDGKAFERMEKARAKARQAPGGATEASDFAFQVTLLFTQGVGKRQPIPPGLVDEAVKCIDEARQANPDDEADLLIRKGEMLLAAGKNEPGAGALRASIAIRPVLRAFTPLAKYYAAQKLTAEAEVLCKKTLPAMKSDESRYAVLDECLKCSEAATPEAGLRWAPAKDIAFYKARKRDLEARLAAGKQARAKEEEKEAKKK